MRSKEEHQIGQPGHKKNEGRSGGGTLQNRAVVENQAADERNRREHKRGVTDGIVSCLAFRHSILFAVRVESINLV
jgi:hypothetical protein